MEKEIGALRQEVDFLKSKIDFLEMELSVEEGFRKLLDNAVNTLNVRQDECIKILQETTKVLEKQCGFL